LTLRGTELASIALLAAAQSKGRSVSYAKPGSEELRYLDFMQANANVGGESLTQILLRHGPRKIEVIEEFLHGTQHRIGLIAKLGVDGAERHVKEFMVRHRRLLRICHEDVVILNEMLGG
jgi:hypothetical protein